MSDYIDKIRKLYEWSEEVPRSEMKYAVERLEYFEQELFKYAQFAVKDEIEICKDLNITKDTHPGWYSCKDRLQIGCWGIIEEVDHYKGKFRYAVNMRPEREDASCFCIQEEFLKPKGWDGRKNGENNQ